ncbi:MAG: hypothetical protein JO249_04195 [Acidobacteria bacterium]|nr:hypothetical protein [Acidobacteriota bacterium]
MNWRKDREKRKTDGMRDQGQGNRVSGLWRGLEPQPTQMVAKERKIKEQNAQGSTSTRGRSIPAKSRLLPESTDRVED